MGILEWIKSKLGKPWLYELQVFENGWHTISELTDKKRKEDYQDLFEPGKLYRLMRKDPDSLRYDKMVWRHFEPSPVIPVRRPKKEREERPPPQPITPSQYMKVWAEGLREYLEPIRMIGEVARDIREAFSGIGGESSGGIPPIEFEGKAPWFMHPYVAKTWGDVAKEVIDHGAKRLGEVIEKAKSTAVPVAEEEEAQLPGFPSIEEYEEYAREEEGEEYGTEEAEETAEE